MTSHTWLFVSWIIIGALFLFTHLVLVYRVLRSGRLPSRLRWAVLPLPFLAPGFAWWDGSRGMPLIWLLLVLAYTVLRSME